MLMQTPGGLPDAKEIAQIALVAAVVFLVVRRLTGTRAIRVAAVLVCLLVIYFVARLLQLDLIRFVIEKALAYGVFAAIVIFQPELRSMAARLGRHRVVRFLTRLEENELVDQIAHAAERLSRAKIGAIIAIEGKMSLEEYAETGTQIQARVSADIVVSLFLPYAPLHDGAVLVSADTLIAAGVILPLTQLPVADKTLGTRHRAALGLSEETDALVIVVSEETQQISLARRGRLERDVSPERLHEALVLACTPGAQLEER
jgi:diadenylate cyclase